VHAHLLAPSVHWSLARQWQLCYLCLGCLSTVYDLICSSERLVSGKCSAVQVSRVEIRMLQNDLLASSRQSLLHACLHRCGVPQRCVATAPKSHQLASGWMPAQMDTHRVVVPMGIVLGGLSASKLPIQHDCTAEGRQHHAAGVAHDHRREVHTTQTHQHSHHEQWLR
jgi:hypothetical protein